MVKNISNAALFIPKCEEDHGQSNSHVYKSFFKHKNKNIQEGKASKTNFNDLKYNCVMKKFETSTATVLWTYFSQL